MQHILKVKSEFRFVLVATTLVSATHNDTKGAGKHIESGVECVLNSTDPTGRSELISYDAQANSV